MTTLKNIAKISKQKEILFNENNTCLSPLGLFSIKENLNGLTLIIRGGYYNKNDGTSILISDEIINLTISNTHYIYFNTTTNLIEINTTGFSNGNIALYTVTTNTTKITNISDKRKIALFKQETPNNFYVPPYVLPKATSSTIGGVKPDGGTIVVNGFGTITDVTNPAAATVFNINLNSNVLLATKNVDYDLLSISLTEGTYFILYYATSLYDSANNSNSILLELKDTTTSYSHSFASMVLATTPQRYLQSFKQCLITLTEPKTLTLKGRYSASSGTNTATILATTNSGLSSTGATRLIALKI